MKCWVGLGFGDQFFSAHMEPLTLYWSQNRINCFFKWYINIYCLMCLLWWDELIKQDCFDTVSQTWKYN